MKTNENKILAIYNAFVDYHNSILHVRFTIAGLYLTASGFLVGSWFSKDSSSGIKILIPLLGVLLAAFCILLEARTAFLLKYVKERGKTIEDDYLEDGNEAKSFSDMKTLGFFNLMNEQLPKDPEWSYFKELNNKETRSHSVGLFLIYLIIIIFWIIVLLNYCFQIWISHAFMHHMFFH